MVLDSSLFNLFDLLSPFVLILAVPKLRDDSWFPSLWSLQSLSPLSLFGPFVLILAVLSLGSCL